VIYFGVLDNGRLLIISCILFLYLVQVLLKASLLVHIR